MSAKKNTLFNYFSKSPANTKTITKTPPDKSCQPSAKTPSDKSFKTPSNKSSKTPSDKSFKTPSNKSSKTPSDKSPVSDEGKENAKSFSNKLPKEKKSASCRKRIIEPEDPDPENGVESDEDDIHPTKKPKDYLIDSEDSGDEYVPDRSASESEGMEEGEEEHSESEPHTESDSESPVKKKRKRPIRNEKPNKKMLLKSNSKPIKAVASNSKLAKLTTPSKSNGTEETQVAGDENANWTFLKYDFLKPDKIKDAKRRSPSDPNYDPKTLYIPDDFLRNQSPGMRQWWDIKAKYFDCVLFFKVGKFYEFYHMDAVTGVKELSLTFMRGEYAHCGFPEIAYARFASTLVDKGYKVARIEQTETPDMMAERCRKSGKTTKFDRVVGRKVCRVTTKGTRVFGIVDGESKDATSNFLLGIAEKEYNGKPMYGVCFVDTSIGIFHIGQFTDDRHSSRLRTLIAKYPPTQVLLERNHFSKQTQQVINSCLVAAIKENLAPESEFWSSPKTLTNLAEGNYFPDNSFPEELKNFTGEGDSFTLMATEESELGVRSLGAVVWFLKRCLVDHQLLSMGQFQIYTPVDLETPQSEKRESEITSRHMVLDAVTLKNLNITENNSGGIEGTLLQKLDHCCTSFGKRLLHHWLCNPLTKIKSIESRQKAISALREKPDVIKEVRSVLIKVPDLERLLSRIHAESTKGVPEGHPENEAIFFEEKTYSKRKIIDFISILNGFQTLQQVAEMLQESEIGAESEILCQCSHFPTSDLPGKFPDLTENIEFFKNAFDHEEAEKEGRIIPSPGVDPDYDSALEELTNVESEMKQYLKEQCEHFGCKVTYSGTDKKRCIEVPESVCRKAGSGYELQGQRKGFKKYTTAEIKDLVEKLQAAQEAKLNVLHNLRRRIFSRFSDRYEDWISAVECAAILDVLLSLAEYAFGVDSDICVPVFKIPENKTFIQLKEGKYPCFSGEDNFIPNDTFIGDPANLILLTGPNMGGKSTLMRQVGLLVIMAQLGSMVPAESMELSVVDRIFTRIGANDDIMSGESTFYLELCETSAILSHATKHSLVLIDELGRGTSTYDGTAIASAVLKELCRMECRTIFSTHYHSLVEGFKDYESVSLAHMACKAETEEDSEGDEGTQETVTFLYKLAPGACPKSYGFNAARLAGVPSHITKLGSIRAKQLEKEANNRKLFRAIFASDNVRESIALL